MIGAQAGIVLALLLIAIVAPDRRASLMLLAGPGFALINSQMFYVMATLNVLFLLLWPLFNLVRHRRDVQVMESKLIRS